METPSVISSLDTQSASRFHPQIIQYSAIQSNSLLVQTVECPTDAPPALIDAIDAVPQFKRFTCNYCNAAFTKKCKLIRHMSVHVEYLKTHKCTSCIAKFNNVQSLQKHMLVHSGLKPYTCEECGRQFRDTSNLKKHILKHKGKIIKKYECQQCDKKYNKKSSLNTHLKTHDKDMQWTCSYCSRTFYYKHDLERHENIHSAIKQYLCKFCNTLFKRKDNFVRHMRNAHPNEPIQDDNLQLVEKPKSVNFEKKSVLNPVDDGNCLFHIGEKFKENEDFIPRPTPCLFETINTVDSENATRLEILEANNKRESVIFKSILNTDQPKQLDENTETECSPKQNYISNNLADELKDNNPKNVITSNPESNSQCNTTANCSSDGPNTTKYTEETYNREYPQYIHKKVNYDHMKDLRDYRRSTSPCQLLEKYSNFDDAEASRCLHQLSSKTNLTEEGAQSKKHYSPESIELYRKILFPGYSNCIDKMKSNVLQLNSEDDKPSPPKETEQRHEVENHWKRKITQSSQNIT